MAEMKTKYDARQQLKQLGWSDEELDAIGLTLHDEGKTTMPKRPWVNDNVSWLDSFSYWVGKP
jgi:hypothetical protein